MPAEQAVPSSHGIPVEQHGESAKPHSEHSGVVEPTGVVQTVSLSVHTLPGQHGESMVPQGWQEPFAPEHTCCSLPSIEHVAPGATHVAAADDS